MTILFESTRLDIITGAQLEAIHNQLMQDSITYNNYNGPFMHKKMLFTTCERCV